MCIEFFLNFTQIKSWHNHNIDHIIINVINKYALLCIKIVLIMSTLALVNFWNIRYIQLGGPTASRESDHEQDKIE